MIRWLVGLLFVVSARADVLFDETFDSGIDSWTSSEASKGDSKYDGEWKVTSEVEKFGETSVNNSALMIGQVPHPLPQFLLGRPALTSAPLRRNYQHHLSLMSLWLGAFLCANSCVVVSQCQVHVVSNSEIGLANSWNPNLPQPPRLWSTGIAALLSVATDQPAYSIWGHGYCGAILGAVYKDNGVRWVIPQASVGDS